ncbi:hypothetical protein [Haloarchaeobius sp. TZWWS8]|uniref:hypothetical protein n=1 Tax=Haloarchaeobius sp. TZWWS8 TaxID=3446121 RepID=UPI003EBC6CCB
MPDGDRRAAGRYAIRLAVALTVAVLVAEPVLAHSGSLGGSLTSVPIPFWLIVLSGGGIIGASFLFTSFATDHEFIRWINRLGVVAPTPAAVWRFVATVARVGSVAVLGLFVAVGLVGPTNPTNNLAVLGIWAGWWAGYTASVYLVGDTWPAVNPWRTLSRYVPRFGEREWPGHLGGWPATVGLLALVWVEVVSPLASVPQLLAGVVLAYTVATLVGASVYGDDWFHHADPVSRVFRTYGRVAPFRRTANGLSLDLPASALTRTFDDGTDGDVVFVVALLWVTTYDGLVSTPTFAGVVRAIVGVGVPPLLVYLVTALAGFGLFLAVYRFSARSARKTAGSYVSVEAIERRFVWSLVPIAAGYHLAHFLGYFLTFLPTLAAVAVDPMSPPPSPQVAVLPAWWGGLQLAFVVLGHLVAIWVAHAIAFETFTGRIQPIRSQYALAAVMIFYTMTSMWIIAQPYSPPPFL